MLINYFTVLNLKRNNIFNPTLSKTRAFSNKDKCNIMNFLFLHIPDM